VSPDLQLEGELLGHSDLTPSEKGYLKHILTFLQAQSRAPWYLERGSPLNTELFRLFSLGLSSVPKRIGVKLSEIVFFREGSSEDVAMPASLRIA
jgi:hypothetical protein